MSYVQSREISEKSVTNSKNIKFSENVKKCWKCWKMTKKRLKTHSSVNSVPTPLNAYRPVHMHTWPWVRKNDIYVQKSFQSHERGLYICTVCVLMPHYLILRNEIECSLLIGCFGMWSPQSCGISTRQIAPCSPPVPISSQWIRGPISRFVRLSIGLTRSCLWSNTRDLLWRWLPISSHACEHNMPLSPMCVTGHCSWLSVDIVRVKSQAGNRSDGRSEEALEMGDRVDFFACTNK